MAKKFWGLKVEESELAEWKEAAVRDGVLLSEWVRGACNEMALPAGAGEFKAAIEENFTATFADQPGTISDLSEPMPVGRIERLDRKTPKTLVKACEHGVEKGYRCWRCGGLAKI